MCDPCAERAATAAAPLARPPSPSSACTAPQYTNAPSHTKHQLCAGGGGQERHSDTTSSGRRLPRLALSIAAQTLAAVA